MAFSGYSASIAVKVSIFDWTIGLYSTVTVHYGSCRGEVIVI